MPSLIHRLSLGAGALTLLGAGPLASVAHAGSYPIRVCHQSYGNVNNVFADITDGVDDTANGGSCSTSGDKPSHLQGDYRGLQVRHGVNRNNQYYGRGARLQANVPQGGMAITDMQAIFGAQVSNHGWSLGVWDASQQRESAPGFGGWAYRHIAGIWTASLQIAAWCNNSSSCYRSYSPAAQQVVRDITLTVHDPHHPAHVAQSGDLWNGSVWHKGTRTLNWRADDNIGIKRLEAHIEGTQGAGNWQLVGATTVDDGCSYVSWRPCPTSRDASIAVNTAEFSNGPHRILLRAIDAADNTSDSFGQVYFDNAASAAPKVELAGWMKKSGDRGLLGGTIDTGWQVTENVALQWPTGDGASASGTASSELQACPVSVAFGGAGCVSASRTGAEFWSATAKITATGYGMWKARARTINNAGTTGAWSDEVNFKYDPRTPGTADLPRNTALEDEDGFVIGAKREDFSQRVEMAAEQEKLTSGAGIRGYSVTVQKPGDPAADPDGDLGDADDVTAVQDGTDGVVALAELPPGSTVIKARAIGGNGKPAAAFSTITLKGALDSDNDGIRDEKDACPDQAGTGGAPCPAPPTFTPAPLPVAPLPVVDPIVALPGVGDRVAWDARCDYAGVEGLCHPLAGQPVGTPNGQNASRKARAQLDLLSGKRSNLPVKSAKTRYGRKMPLRGQLKNDQGKAITGAKVVIIEMVRFQRWRVLSTVKTNTRGVFSYRHRKSGPTRNWRAVYFPFAGDVDHERSNATQQLVAAGVRMTVGPKALRNGQAVTFGGRLLGGHLPRKGVLVNLQAFRDGRWGTFRTVRVSKTGKFAVRYRFRRTTTTSRYRFRALVVQQSASPWMRGTSPQRRVLVRAR